MSRSVIEYFEHIRDELDFLLQNLLRCCDIF